MDILGDGTLTPARLIWAITIIMVLLGALALVLKRFGTGRLQGFRRGRLPRLGVVDVASIDTRRKLVIVRRDNVEHLILIGGPNDVVIETSINPSEKPEAIIPASTQTPAPASADAPKAEKDMSAVIASLKESASA